MKKNLVMLRSAIVLLIMVFSADAFAQFEMSAQLRPRAEYRHGYKTLPTPDDNPAFFISQRTRLNFDYTAKKFILGVSLQDVRTWGDNPQLNASDNNSSLHQAWGQYFFTEAFSIVAGRQEIVYDDARMFGNVDWAQQGRSHDAAILRFDNESLRIDAGLAWNQEKEKLYGTEYLLKGNYKTFQYLWLHKKLNKFKISVLFLNNGMEYMKTDTTFRTLFSQTLGTRLSYATGKLAVNGAFYYQGGTDAMDVSLDAYYFAADVKFNFTETFAMLLGFEYLSGTNQRDAMDSTYNKNNSFTPFYGTNHKFNGHMDYFYVGNHINSVGLRDLYLSFIYKKRRFSGVLTLHNFCSAAKVMDPDDPANDLDNSLGMEVDFGVGYQLAESLVLKAGYSQMFATATMEAIKGGDKGQVANWAWVMLSFSPTLLSK
jgi:hypothetical protein